MTIANSRAIESNQQGLHQRLDDTVLKHLATPFNKPFHDATLETFYRLKQWIEADGRPLIFDSCCGVGESSANLARRHPEAVLIGMDKSAHRLDKHENYRQQADNYLLARVDLNDLWRLAVADGWQLSHHYLLYPNPWPKSSHLKRRWHGAAAFPYLLMLGGQLEMRSNWPVYLQEFARALTLAGVPSQLAPLSPSGDDLTPFERKYRLSGQPLYQLQADLSGFTLPWQAGLSLPPLTNS
ncbi:MULTISPECIES: tRNA (guanosine(46)-N(7))-methyltransferase TrmB [Ferrimonas]|uniref:tRNA (guanine(46)-N(7))-methyltransferase TrmB n=1 Tax=Ferrimonas TaxID=44011 RepID=UPI0003FFC929|nr:MULTISPECIES: SAM-dependent methyltransferase [Ferrimonas]USD36986.1 SAM-dependent methyltransferase [Ferrimonas sp. SCSIO 43195]